MSYEEAIDKLSGSDEITPEELIQIRVAIKYGKPENDYEWKNSNCY